MRRHGVLRCGQVSARVRPWARTDHTAFLVVSEQPGGDRGAAQPSPPGTGLTEWIGVLSEWGYQRARTNAVGPGLSSWFAAGGFTVTQHLALLQTTLGDDRVTDAGTPNAGSAPGMDQVRSCSGRVGAFAALRPRGMGRAILEVDGESFPETWAFDEQSLSDALRATPSSRIFHIDAESPGPSSRNDMAGFLIVGLAGRTAYIQRLAVRPGHRRSGVARALMGAGLRWSRSKGCTQAVVNTEVGNAAALALYEGLGFTRMNHDLNVMEKAW